MTPDEKRAFCREWFARGVCPGCGAPLQKVAGKGHRHYLAGRKVPAPKAGGYRVTVAGESFQRGLALNPKDPRLCPYTADDLTSLCLIATDFGRRTEEVTAGSQPPSTASPFPTPVASSVGRPNDVGSDRGQPSIEARSE